MVLLLIIAGIVLLLAELLLTPGVGACGILGLGALGYSTYTAYTTMGTTVGNIILAADILLVAGFTVWALRSKTWKKFSLDTKIESKVGSSPEQKGIAAGDEGVTLTRLNPMGKARIGGQVVEVSSCEGLVDPESRITVADIEDGKIIVKKTNHE